MGGIIERELLQRYKLSSYKDIHVWRLVPVTLFKTKREGWVGGDIMGIDHPLPGITILITSR